MEFSRKVKWIAALALPVLEEICGKSVPLNTVLDPHQVELQVHQRWQEHFGKAAARGG